jgi:hypothetical protein
MPEAAPNPFSALSSSPPPPAPAAAPPAKPLATSNPMEGDAQARFRLQQEALTRSDPWRDPSVTITKAPDGTVTAQPRGGDPAAAPQPAEPPGPASVEGGRLRIGEIELSEQDVRGPLERKGLEDSRKALMPASADGYTLPVDMQLPPGVQFQWQVDNEVLGPALAQAKQIAFDAGLSNDQFGRLMSVYASAQIHEQQQYARAQAAEVAKLGDLANVRMDSLKTWLNSQLGTEAAKALTTTLFTAGQVQAFEKLMHKFVTQGSGGFNGAHREPTIPGKISDEAYGKLSYAERIEYASRFPQQPGGR